MSTNRLERRRIRIEERMAAEKARASELKALRMANPKGGCDKLVIKEGGLIHDNQCE